MRRGLAALVSVTFALAAIIAKPSAGAQQQDSQQQGLVKITTCQTISESGSYRLANDIGGVPGDCLVITASFVSIDLAGFSIVGGEGTAIIVPRSSGQLLGIAVRNGSIYGFVNGVDLGSAVDSIVEGLRIEVGGIGSTIGIAATGIVRNNLVEGGRETGINATGIVTGNYADGRIFGIEAGPGSTVIGNTASGSIYAFAVGCPANVTDNTAAHGNIVVGSGCTNTNNAGP
jgi:hypothetical protein